MEAQMTLSAKQSVPLNVPQATPKRVSCPPGQLLIGGKWRDAQDGASMPTSDPTTELTITEVARASAADIEAAVEAAARSFEMGQWSRMHHEQRAKILFRMADLLDERAEEFAVREAMDMGMPYHTSAIQSCRIAPAFFASLVALQ